MLAIAQNARLPRRNDSIRIRQYMYVDTVTFMGLVLLRPMRWTEKAVRVRVRRRKEVHRNPRMSRVCCNRICGVNCVQSIIVLKCVVERYSRGGGGGGGTING